LSYFGTVNFSNEYIVKHISVVTLITGWMIPFATNSPPLEVSS